MKGLLFKDKNTVAIEDVPRPECLPNTVVAKVDEVGICGSDVHMFAGHWGKQPEKVVGHELAGTVVEVGEGVTGFRKGDRVCVECFRHCGVCDYCRTGRYNLCIGRAEMDQDLLTGAFAEYARLPVEAAFRMPAGATADQTAVVEPAAVACRAVSLLDAKPGDRVLVVGGGTIGLLCAAVLKARYRLQCMLTVKYDQQAEMAEKFGIDKIIRVGQARTVDAVKDWTGGKLCDAAIDTVGSTMAVADAADSLRPSGSLCLLAFPGGRTMMPMGTVVGKELRLIGSNCYAFANGRKDFDAAIDLIASGDLPAEQIITHRYKFDDAAEAFATAADKKSGSVKVVLEL